MTPRRTVIAKTAFESLLRIVSQLSVFETMELMALWKRPGSTTELWEAASPKLRQRFYDLAVEVTSKVVQLPPG